MGYRAIVDFKDLLSGEEYKAGDIYPRTGEADAKRVQQLITPTTQRGALIEEVVEEAVDPVVEAVVEAPAPIPSPKKRKKKGE